MNDTADSVILRALQAARSSRVGPVYRTALVKLVYLVDYIYAQHSHGRTITGFQYVWDDFGPNAVHNAIVKRADVLESSGQITIQRGATPAGSSKYVYEATANAANDALDDELAEIILQDVVRAYGGLRWSEIVMAAKETRPFKKAKQGDPLDLTPSQPQAERLARLQAAASDGRYESPGTTVTIDELKSRYGLDP